MRDSILASQAQAQAAYFNVLRQKAIEIIKAQKPETLSFDPQGRVLVDVPLSQAERNVPAHSETQLGIQIKPTTTVSVDVRMDAYLSTLFQDRLRGYGIPEDLVQWGIKNHNNIIPLQQEFYFHLGLAKRLYQKIAHTSGRPIDPHLFHEAHQAALRNLNVEVLKTYTEALKASTLQKEPFVDEAQLNYLLDKARGDLIAKGHDFLMRQVVEKTGLIVHKEDLKKAKQWGEETTATGNDVLHLDKEGLSTWIEGSEETAHHRKPGALFAHRRIISHFNGDNSIAPHIQPRIQIRIPSPVVKKESSFQETDYVDDAEKKLSAVSGAYRLAERLSGGGVRDKPRAFIYNSYTAIHDRLGDRGDNKQTQSARHILKGMHRYNKGQLAHTPPVFCFVQNIAVNRWGYSLSHKSRSHLVRESALMTEMALIHTLYDSMDDKTKGFAHNAFNAYENFLRTSKPDTFFFDSPESKDAYLFIQLIKDRVKYQDLIVPSDQADHIVYLAKEALKKLIANNEHLDKNAWGSPFLRNNDKYCKLIQALSVFVEEASIGGCKSGNERAQSVTGRVELLDRVVRESAKGESGDPDILKIKELLKKLGTANPKNIKQCADDLNNGLNEVYNDRGLQGAVSMISLDDQAGPSKLQAWKRLAVNRNFAEDSLSKLHQSKASQMQAHRGFNKYMSAAWEGQPMSLWGRMKSIFGDKGAVAVAVISAIVVPVVGFLCLVGGVQLYNQFKNKQGQEALHKELGKLAAKRLQGGMDNSQEHSSLEENNETVAAGKSQDRTETNEEKASDKENTSAEQAKPASPGSPGHSRLS